MRLVKLFRRLKYVFILLIISNQLSAQQGNITGRLIDENNNIIAYVNVRLLSIPDSAFINGTLSDSLGNFNLSNPGNGSYILNFNSIGFISTYSGIFTLNDQFEDKSFHNIILKQDSKLLKEANVSSLRPAVIHKADRMVITIEGTALAAGNTAFEVLAKSPGIFIDGEGNIRLNGKSGVTIMIDNKLTYLNATELRNLLESMPAENLKDIEIISNPSAAYDAEGTSGILNLNLKKNTQRGMNGSVYSNGNYNFTQFGMASGGNINFKTSKWNSFLNLDFSRRVGGREATFTRVFYAEDQSTYFDQVATGNWRSQGIPSVRAGTDYNINERHSVGIMTYIVNNSNRNDFLTETYLSNSPGQPYMFINADNYSHNKFENYSGNLHYAGKLDTSGKKITADLDYIRIRHHSESNFYNYFTTLTDNFTTTDFLYTKIPSGFDIYAAKSDLTLPFSEKLKLESGIKASRVISDNDSRFYFNNDSLVPDPLRTNHFIYTENIYAVYLNFSGRLSPKLSWQAGLRAEMTESTGEQVITDEITNRQYTDFFPSVFLQQEVSKNYDISYSYGRRLHRPHYGELNPFIFYRDPYTKIQGNPFLRPEYSHVFGITQNIKKTYNISLELILTKDEIAELPYLEVEEATTIYFTGNVDETRSANLTVTVPFQIIKNWETNNTFNLIHDRYSLYQNNEKLINEELFYMVQSQHTMVLPKDYRIELNMAYRGPGAYGLYHLGPQWWVNAAIKKQFLSKKLEVTAGITDIFKSQRLVFTTDIGDNINEFDQYFRNRRITLSFRYNFSKGAKVEQRNNSNLEELNRTGG